MLATAQPSWAKNARTRIVTLFVVEQSGDTLTSPAFFSDASGSVIAPFKPLQKAKRAWASDEKGATYEIKRIAGFNSTYNVARLVADVSKKKPSPLTLRKARLAEGATVYLMPSAEADRIVKVENANGHGYYTLSATADPAVGGNPLMNEDGEVVAVIQTPVQAPRAPFYALDINFALELAMTAMDVNNSDLLQCSIMKQLPAEESQAKSFMYLCQGDTPTKVAYADDFIAAYPQSPSGYVQKAECLAGAGDFAGATKAYEQGLRAKVSESHEILYSRASVAYQLAVGGQPLPSGWSLDNALSDIREASSLNALPVYTLCEARILYALKDYEGAADKFAELTQTNMRTPDLYIYIAQCRENLGASPEETLALNDSAVACFTKPYTVEAANYLWLRASTLKSLKRYREAIADLDDYEHLLAGNLTDNFYYEREQLETQVRMYAQAINDIQKAISLNADEPVYHAEQAVLLYRVGNLDEAVAACRKALQLDADFPDAHRILGVCLRDKGQTDEAKQELRKAIELGDELAQGVLDQM